MEFLNNAGLPYFVRSTKDTLDNKVNLERKSEKDVEVLPITDGKEMSWRWSKNKFIDEPHNIIISRNNDNISIYKKNSTIRWKNTII